MIDGYWHMPIMISRGDMRPKRCRNICCNPDKRCFKPKGIPVSELEIVNMGLDEFEAIRLADLAGMYQEKAAQAMGVSRQTFGRIVESARGKIADALVNGKALVIEEKEKEIQK